MSDFSIEAHRLRIDGKPVGYRETPNRSGTIQPEVIVLHDTASRLDMSSVDWLCNKQAKASAHFVVGRAGEIVQLAPTNVATWHAGVSSYRGRSGVNAFSIGIEIVNPGRMERLGDDAARAWYGQVFEVHEAFILPKTTAEHGAGMWMAYTAAQVEAVSAIVAAARTAYPSIAGITTHYEISPGRKVDVNPLFPLDEVRARFRGEAGAEPRAGVPEGPTAVTTAGVNHRRWPSYADNVLQVIPARTLVEVVRAGTYTNGAETARWFLVRFGGHEGWVHGAYLQLD